MDGTMKPLSDDAARRDAMVQHGRSLLIEAGAGSGKTAIMAGRIALMLAAGIQPKNIAAVTFTELAASELLIRVRNVASELNSGRVPKELRIALTAGITPAQRANLATAGETIDEITCTTIHGFCQRLITPYPIEANIDPGASVVDRSQGELLFDEIVDGWLREQLDGGDDGLLAALVIQDRKGAVDLVQTIARNLRRHPDLQAAVPPDVPAAVQAFRQASATFSAFMHNARVDESETEDCASQFAELAARLQSTGTAPTAAHLVDILAAEPGNTLRTTAGTFRKFQKKGKWEAAAKAAGFSKADGGEMFEAAKARYDACGAAWEAMQQAVASRVLADLVEIVQPVGLAYRDAKRNAALLDFDDLIRSARDLLRDHELVRQALSRRYAHVLVDEFQDTDPLQAEIFWRLCGDAPADADDADWTCFHVRPGALFLVGDPKQAIYRFRGADVAAYLQARERLLKQDGSCLLSIATNFRSCAPILDHVNKCFEAPFSVENQPGFTALDAFHPAREAGVCVAALDVAAADETGKASADRQRDAEAEAVADLCMRLIGDEQVFDVEEKKYRPCRPGDIALLAPSGADLWRYEAALEERGIPIATQAGKGFFRRQEIQDLIAITRVLADARDTLALGALLRGPLVGLSEEELLDIVWNMPRSDEKPDDLPRLDVHVDPACIGHALARDVVERLQSLRRQARRTTPYALLSQAVDVLRVRPILLQRHGGQAERALANVDLFLSLSQAYAVRGLKDFAAIVTAAWTEKERTIEGRPDAQDEAVALYTMHSAKGLEWPIVIPINTVTEVHEHKGAVIERDSLLFHCRVLGVKPAGYQAAVEAEQAERGRERVRLWYVAATRAKELLILPRMDVEPGSSAWVSMVDLSLKELNAFDASHLSPKLNLGPSLTRNDQTREIFAGEAAFIADQHETLRWLVPSRSERHDEQDLESEPVQIGVNVDNASVPSEATEKMVQGSRERGLILHKLLEEVLTGETLDTDNALARRAATLIEQLGQKVESDSKRGLSPAEIAGCVTRAFALPEIKALRHRLTPEFHVYGSSQTDDAEEVAFGITDAIGFDQEGNPDVIVDWKSDVDPTPAVIKHYRTQVGAYLEMTQAKYALIVFVTSGTLLTVEPCSPSAHRAADELSVV